MACIPLLDPHPKILKQCVRRRSYFQGNPLPYTYDRVQKHSAYRNMSGGIPIFITRRHGEYI